MKEEFNYSHIPVEFPYCFERNCTKYEKCLHGFMCKYLTDEPHIITAVNPLQARPQGECPHFKTTDKCRYAKGMTRVFDNLPHKIAQEIKARMKVRYSERKFYKILNGEKTLSPEEQSDVKQIFVNCGVTDEIVYDKYIYTYRM